jgi:hypothetical protein
MIIESVVMDVKVVEVGIVDESVPQVNPCMKVVRGCIIVTLVTMISYAIVGGYYVYIYRSLGEDLKTFWKPNAISIIITSILIINILVSWYANSSLNNKNVYYSMLGWPAAIFAIILLFGIPEFDELARNASFEIWQFYNVSKYFSMVYSVSFGVVLFIHFIVRYCI